MSEKLHNLSPTEKASLIAALVESLSDDLGGLEVLSEKIGMSASEIVHTFDSELFSPHVLSLEKQVRQLSSNLAACHKSIKEHMALNIKHHADIAALKKYHMDKTGEWPNVIDDSRDFEIGEPS